MANSFHEIYAIYGIICAHFKGQLRSEKIQIFVAKETLPIDHIKIMMIDVYRSLGFLLLTE